MEWRPPLRCCTQGPRAEKASHKLHGLQIWTHGVSEMRASAIHDVTFCTRAPCCDTAPLCTPHISAFSLHKTRPQRLTRRTDLQTQEQRPSIPAIGRVVLHTKIIKTPQSGRDFPTRPCRTSNQLKACRGAGQTSADTVWREHDMNHETLICYQVVWCRESFIGLTLSPCPPTYLSVMSISSKRGIPLIASITSH